MQATTKKAARIAEAVKRLNASRSPTVVTSGRVKMNVRQNSSVRECSDGGLLSHLKLERMHQRTNATRARHDATCSPRSKASTTLAVCIQAPDISVSWIWNAERSKRVTFSRHVKSHSSLAAQSFAHASFHSL